MDVEQFVLEVCSLGKREYFSEFLLVGCLLGIEAFEFLLKLVLLLTIGGQLYGVFGNNVGIHLFQFCYVILFSTRSSIF